MAHEMVVVPVVRPSLVLGIELNKTALLLHPLRYSWHTEGLERMTDTWDGEEWRGVVGYEGLYEISSLGRVRNIARRSGTRPGLVLKQKIDRYGYPQVILTHTQKAKTLKIHTLVAEAFIGARPHGSIILHTDGNSMNNTPGNLRYGTYKNNINDSKIHGTFAPGRRKDGKSRTPYKTARTFHLPTPEQVREVRRLANSQSYRSIAKATGVSRSLAHRIATGEAYSDVI